MSSMLRTSRAIACHARCSLPRNRRLLGTSSIKRNADVPATSAISSSTIPWYEQYNQRFLKENDQNHRISLPELPKDPPTILHDLTEYLARDLILQDISIIDLRATETPWGNETIMLVCTAQTERQLRSGSESVKTYLRQLGCKPRIDGLISWQNTRVKRRRRRKMIGRANYQFEDDSLNWLFIDAGSDGIIIQMMTEKGRQEYQLEELWASQACNQVTIPTPRSMPITTIGSISGGALSRRLYSTNRP